jgi:hypothetical protein
MLHIYEAELRFILLRRKRREEPCKMNTTHTFKRALIDLYEECI